jgi:hypothetical protein
VTITEREIAIRALTELLTEAGVLRITPAVDTALANCVDALIAAARAVPPDPEVP